MTEKKKPTGLTPKSDRISLSEVIFKVPTAIDGFAVHQRYLVADCPRDDGTAIPHLSFDPSLRVVVVGRHMIPVEGVANMRRLH